MRDSRPLSPTVSASREAVICSTMSPALWPSVSLTVLKLSRSMKSSARRPEVVRLRHVVPQRLQRRVAVAQAGEQIEFDEMRHLALAAEQLADQARSRRAKKPSIASEMKLAISR